MAARGCLARKALVAVVEKSRAWYDQIKGLDL